MRFRRHEQFCTDGFQASTQVLLKSAAPALPLGADACTTPWEVARRPAGDDCYTGVKLLCSVKPFFHSAICLRFIELAAVNAQRSLNVSVPQFL